MLPMLLMSIFVASMSYLISPLSPWVAERQPVQIAFAFFGLLDLFCCIACPTFGASTFLLMYITEYLVQGYREVFVKYDQSENDSVDGVKGFYKINCDIVDQVDGLVKLTSRANHFMAPFFTVLLILFLGQIIINFYCVTSIMFVPEVNLLRLTFTANSLVGTVASVWNIYHICRCGQRLQEWIA